MAWETRGNGQYYYRKRRNGSRVVTEYVGNDRLADLTAAQDAAERRERQEAAAHWRQMVEEDRRHDAGLAQVDNLVSAVVGVVLIANGYHTHKRQWRKMRDE